MHPESILPMETRPRHPLPVDYRPPMSVPYRVKDFDSRGRPETWKTVAAEHRLGVDPLIHFNFHTTDPGEVNWYLRRNVGCNVLMPDGLHWRFTASAMPGIIYLPIRHFDVDSIDAVGQPTISPLALDFEGPPIPLGAIGKTFDSVQMLEWGLAIAGVALGELVMLGIDIEVAPIGPFPAIGGLLAAPLNDLRKRQIAEGLCLGLVMTADGRSARYIREHGFFMLRPVRNIPYPEHGTQLQGICNQALAAGIAHGRQFNAAASANLFRWIGAQFAGDALQDCALHEPSRWDDRKWDDYYRLCATILRKKIVSE